MCLIQTGPSALVRKTLLETSGMIKDIFTSNGDGIGAMYATKKRGLRVVKALPRTTEEAEAFIRNLPNDDRLLALHWRMRTHGLTDLENCHPYTVVPGKVAMMHNGILHTGNKEDTTKSDTWHFIQTYLADTVAQAPDVVHAPGFIKMCAQFIEDNRFVFMDDQGRLTIINEDQGVRAAGLWFSNTYAWSPEMLIEGYKPRFRYAAWDEETWGEYVTQRYGSKGTSYSGGKRSAAWGPNYLTDLVEAVNSCNVEEVYTAINDWPYSATEGLFKRMAPSPTAAMSKPADIGKLSSLDAQIFEAVISFTGGKTAFHNSVLYGMAKDHPRKLAEVICYYFDWTILIGAPTGKQEDPPKTEGGKRKGLVELRKDPHGNAEGAKNYTYRGHTFSVFFDDGATKEGDWNYFTTRDEDGRVVANGYSYDSRAEAMSWACEEIDDMIDDLEKEARRALDDAQDEVDEVEVPPHVDETIVLGEDDDDDSPAVVDADELRNVVASLERAAAH